MAAFEYLTVNSLTSYPFRDGRAENAVQPITADTFLDIVFVLYSPNISRPYIKQIRAVNQDLSIDFHDVDGDAAIFTVNIPAADVVSHYKNKQKSFFGYRPTGYYPNAAVKLVFGDGIKKIAENGLTVDYTSEETELSPSAVLSTRSQRRLHRHRSCHARSKCCTSKCPCRNCRECRSLHATRATNCSKQTDHRLGDRACFLTNYQMAFMS